MLWYWYIFTWNNITDYYCSQFIQLSFSHALFAVLSWVAKIKLCLWLHYTFTNYYYFQNHTCDVMYIDTSKCLYCLAIAKFKHCLSPLCLPMIHIIGATLGSRRIRKLDGKAISQDHFNLMSGLQRDSKGIITQDRNVKCRGHARATIVQCTTP